MGFETPWEASYTLEKPAGNWTKADFNDSKWQKSKAPFGTAPYFGIQTPWNTSDIWVRRTIELQPKDMNADKYILQYSHDDIFKLYPWTSSGATWTDLDRFIRSKGITSQRRISDLFNIAIENGIIYKSDKRKYHYAGLSKQTPNDEAEQIDFKP